jgi:hypothetical protein
MAGSAAALPLRRVPSFSLPLRERDDFHQSPPAAGAAIAGPALAFAGHAKPHSDRPDAVISMRRLSRARPVNAATRWRRHY